MALTNDIETAKFTFENVFDPAHTLHGDKTQLDHKTSEDIIAARQEGYNEGFQAGKSDEELTLTRTMNSELDYISSSLSQLIDNMEEIDKKTSHEAKSLAVLIARKLVFNLTKLHPIAGIETLIEDSLKQLGNAPHIVIRLNEKQIDTLRDRIIEISTQLGCAEKVMIVPDPDIAQPDCRIEWADGGIERNSAQIESQLEEIIGRYFPLTDKTTSIEETPKAPGEGDTL